MASTTFDELQTACQNLKRLFGYSKIQYFYILKICTAGLY